MTEVKFYSLYSCSPLFSPGMSIVTRSSSISVARGFSPLLFILYCEYIFSINLSIYEVFDVDAPSVYRGRSDPGDLSLDPSAQECLVQASLINGVLPLLVFHLVFEMRIIQGHYLYRTACTTIAIAIQVRYNHIFLVVLHLTVL